MGNLYKILYIMLDFGLGFMILFIFLWYITRKRLFNIWGMLLASLGIGLSFGIIVFLGTYIGTKYTSWDFAKRLSTAINVFFWAFGGSTICIPLAVKLGRLQSGNNLPPNN